MMPFKKKILVKQFPQAEMASLSSVSLFFVLLVLSALPCKIGVNHYVYIQHPNVFTHSESQTESEYMNCVML